MGKENRNMLAAVTGVIVGAGAVIAGAVALSDRHGKQRANDVLGKVKNKLNSYIKNVQTASDDTDKFISKTAKVATKKINQATKAVKKEVKNI